MQIAVLVKQVPDTWSERKLTEPDWTLDRDAADAVIDEIDTRGVEAALQLTEAHGGEDYLRSRGVEVIVLDDDECTLMMTEFISDRPSLWNEDIGVPD